MDDRAISEQIKPWGYRLLPKPHTDCLGFSGLLVAIRDRPTLRHYDPESIRLRLCTGKGTSDWFVLHRHPHFHESVHVCLGQIELSDRVGKKVEFFSFGGELRSIVEATETIYVLTSDAPVLGISLPNLDAPGEKLALRVEVALAHVTASCCPEDHLVAERLAMVEPMRVYVAAIHTLLRQYDAHAPLRRHDAAQYYALKREKRWLQQAGYWPEASLTLEELLLPAASKG